MMANVAQSPNYERQTKTRDPYLWNTKSTNRYVVFWTAFNATRNDVFFSPRQWLGSHTCCQSFIREKFNAHLCWAIFYECHKNFFLCLILSSFSFGQINVIDLLRLSAAHHNQTRDVSIEHFESQRITNDKLNTEICHRNP